MSGLSGLDSQMGRYKPVLKPCRCTGILEYLDIFRKDQVSDVNKVTQNWLGLLPPSHKDLLTLSSFHYEWSWCKLNPKLWKFILLDFHSTKWTFGRLKSRRMITGLTQTRELSQPQSCECSICASWKWYICSFHYS